MKKHTKKLYTLWRIKQHAEQQACRRKDSAYGYLMQAEEAYKRLKTYQKEYQHTLKEMKPGPVNDKVDPYVHNFVTQLGQALLLQKQQVIMLKHEWEMQQQVWCNRRREATVLKRALKQCG